MKQFLLACLFTAFAATVWAQPVENMQPTQITVKKKHNKSFYFSWGYNAEWYTRSNVKVSQPGLGNDYTLNHVKAHDHKGWDEGIFNMALTIPQYNYRIGYMFNEDKGLGIELNFDHTKYIIQEPQEAHLTGALGGRTVDTSIRFHEDNGFFYYLNNGANFFLINIVKRWHITGDKKGYFNLDFMGKAGVGPVVPHVENSFFGKKNDPHFQIGGWNAGVEGALRATLFRYVYLEYCNKLDYARYSGLKIYQGKVKQAFGTYEMILNLGITIPGKKR